MKKVILVLSIVTMSTTVFARSHHWNSVICEGKVLTTNSSFSEGGGTEASSEIIGTKLQEEHHYKVENKSVAEISSLQSQRKCEDDKGNLLGELNSSKRRFTRIVEINFSNSKDVPLNLRGMKVTDTLSCLDISDETADECP